MRSRNPAFITRALKLSSGVFLFMGFLTTAVAADAPSDEDLLVRAKALHASFLTIDTHLDVPIVMKRPGFDIIQRHTWEDDISQVDFPRMDDGGLDGGFFAVYVGQGPRNPDANADAQATAHGIVDDIIALTEKHPELCALATTPEEASAIRASGRKVIFMGIENGYTIGRDLDQLQRFYERGVRYFGITHTRNNDLGDSSTDPEGWEHFGLSELGKSAVKLCNELGMMIDVSHMSDKSFYDVIGLTKAPVVASHSGAYAGYPHPRNMNDDMLKVIARNGGVVQMNMFSSYMMDVKPDPERNKAFRAWFQKYRSGKELTDEEAAASLAERVALEKKYPKELTTVVAVVDHIDHMVEVMGIDHVGISGDFDGGGGVIGANHVGEMHNITVEMLRRGYTAEELEKFWGGNVMRVLGECQVVAASLQSSAG